MLTELDAATVLRTLSDVYPLTELDAAHVLSRGDHHARVRRGDSRSESPLRSNGHAVPDGREAG